MRDSLDWKIQSIVAIPGPFTEAPTESFKGREWFAFLQQLGLPPVINHGFFNHGLFLS